MELSFNEAKRICALSNADESQRFMTTNIPQVQVSVSCWFAVMEDCGIPNGFIAIIKQYLLKHGLPAVCKSARSFADLLLEHCEESTAAVDFRFITAEYGTQNEFALALAHMLEHLSMWGDVTSVHNVLQVCLFLERFTFANASDKASLGKFREANSICRDYTYNWDVWPGPTLIEMVRYEFRQYFLCDNKEYVSLDKLAGLPEAARMRRISSHDAGFTNGSTNQTKADLLQKWVAYSKVYPNYKGYVQYPLIDGQNGRRTNRYPKLIGVPKTFDTKRIIGPEDPIINFWGTATLQALRESLEYSGTAQYINEHEQEANRSLAAEGAANGGVATIDMSSASDTISKAVFFAVVPPGVRDCILELTSTHVVLPDGTLKKLFTLFTSGHPLTWLLEACYFLALARVGTYLAGYENADELCFAYGDDLIVPVGAYETVVEILQAFGHRVNGRKSYAHGTFRESCGGWYYREFDITPIHWPRRVVSEKPWDLCKALVSIQHNAYLDQWNFPHLIAYCNKKATELDPQMTYSYLFSGNEDLWDPELNPVDSDFRRHWVAREKRTPKKVTPFLEHLVYYQYLEYGPLYESEEDREWGISISRFSQYDTVGEVVVSHRR